MKPDPAFSWSLLCRWSLSKQGTISSTSPPTPSLIATVMKLSTIVSRQLTPQRQMPSVTFSSMFLGSSVSRKNSVEAVLKTTMLRHVRRIRILGVWYYQALLWELIRVPQLNQEQIVKTQDYLSSTQRGNIDEHWYIFYHSWNVTVNKRSQYLSSLLSKRTSRYLQKR